MQHSEGKYYVHTGYLLDRNDLFAKLDNNIPEDYHHTIKDNIYVCSLIYKDSTQSVMDTFYKKSIRKDNITCYIDKLYIKNHKDIHYIGAAILIEGKWYYICINNDNIQPMQFKHMINRGDLGDGIDMNRIGINCSVYRFMTNDKNKNMKL